MKAKNFFMLILALFVGMNLSYANNVKVKKIKYAKNIFYIGEGETVFFDILLPRYCPAIEYSGSARHTTHRIAD